jgi:peptidoglycan/LPS O-acetylase OafA/YrhL/lysophospholipase L1-like esterase
MRQPAAPTWDPPVRPDAGAPGAARPHRYLPGLDGIRGVALVGVLLFHDGRLQGGFLGVDLFFVLSGFLITSLLLSEWDRAHRIDLRRFWSRRVRRLVPAALVVLLFTAGYALLSMDPGQRYRFRWDALSALFDVANWRAIRAGSDYWASFGSASPLRHFWSLSVEEQLYLLWPATVLFGLWLGRARRWGRQAVLLLALGLGVASALVMALVARSGHTERAYYGTDARAWAVLFGAAAAILLSRRTVTAHDPIGRGLRWAAPVAIAVLAVGWTVADGTSLWLYRWGFTSFGLAAAVVIASVASGAPRLLIAVLEVRPLRFLGRISYGAYLWHWPLFVAIDHPLAGSRLLLTVVRYGVTVAVAAVSAHYLEQPIRSGAVPTSRWRPAGLLGVAAVVVAVLAVTAGATAPPTSVAAAGPSKAAVGVPTLLLLGDSEAYNLSLGEAPALGDAVSFAYHARIGCGLGPGLAVTEGGVPVDKDLGGEPCSEANGWLDGAVHTYRPDLVLVYEGAWDVLDRRVDGRTLRFGTRAWDEAVRTNLATVLRGFARDGAQVFVLAAPCYPHGGQGGGHTIRDDPRRVARWNQLLREVAPTVGARVLAYDGLFCGKPASQQPPRDDGVHLTKPGAEGVWRWIAPQLGLTPTAG